MKYEHRDKYHQKAKKEGYPARSAYKIIEIDDKFGVFKKGNKIVDLGCAPGGWLKVAEERICSTIPKKSDEALEPLIVGIDLEKILYTARPEVYFIEGDFCDVKNQQKIIEVLNGKVNWVLSDLAPKTCGVKFIDASNSLDLCQLAFDFAKTVLRPQGGLVLKIFPGADTGKLIRTLKGSFQKVTSFVPSATRLTSKEEYLICQGYKA